MVIAPQNLDKFWRAITNLRMFICMDKINYGNREKKIINKEFICS